MSTFNLREWILTQMNPDYGMKVINDKEIHLDTTYGHGVIRSWPDEIYEFQITNKKDETTGFYLHFQVNNIEHAKELFGEFTEALLKLKQKQKTKVLLCCSSGITTMFFCEKLNEYAQLTGCDYEFNAVNFTRVYELGFDYDIIAIAPQVGYLEKKIKEVLTKKVVVKIPTKIFGSYDTRGAMKFFDALSPKKMDKEEEVLEITKKIDTDRTLLVIGVLREIGNVRIVYRVYDKGVAHEEKLIIKEELKLSDIEDIIDLVMVTQKGITGVCVSLPGIVTHGVVNLPRVDFDGQDIRRILTDKYHMPFVICNNANAIALGIYSSQDKHHSIIYHSQMAGSINSGEGIVCYGKLITGLRGFAGEQWYLAPHLYQDQEALENIWTEEGATEVVAKTLLAPICTVAPKAIYIRCRLTPRMDKIRNILSNFIPDDYIPELIRVESIREYMLLGELMICINELDERDRIGVVV